MSTIGKSKLAVGLFAMCVALSSSPVRAREEEKLIPREGAIELLLLLQPSVQQELKLTMQETTKIDEFAGKQWTKAQEYHKLPEAQRKTKFEELGKANKEFIASTLKPQQEKRLMQIAMQEGGLLFVLDPKISEDLGISPQEKMKLNELQKTAEKQVEDTLHSTSVEGLSEKLEKLRAEHNKQLMSVLSDQQKAKWKEMTGEPFHGKLVFMPFEGAKK